MTTAVHEPTRRRRGRPAEAKALTPVVTTAPPIRFPAPSRYALAVELEHIVCESLNAVGVHTDCGGWLMHPGNPPEALFARAVAHLHAALQAQDYSAGFWTADLEPADDDGSRGRYRLLIGDAWATSAQAVTFRARSVDLECDTVALGGRNAGRRLVRLLAQAAAATLVAARPESVH